MLLLFLNCQVTILSLLIARDISRHLRVHAAFGQASLWSFAEIAVVAARCVAANSIARARTKCFSLAGQKNVGIGAIPSDIISSGNCQMVEVWCWNLHCVNLQQKLISRASAVAWIRSHCSWCDHWCSRHVWYFVAEIVKHHLLHDLVLLIVLLLRDFEPAKVLYEICEWKKFQLAWVTKSKTKMKERKTCNKSRTYHEIHYRRNFL